MGKLITVMGIVLNRIKTEVFKMYVRICKHCGKRYMARSANSQYCSKKCKLEAKEKRRKANADKTKEEKQPCWSCKRTNCTCSWIKYSIPVVGWEAKETIINNGEVRTKSYEIIKCPEYIRGR